MSTLPLSSGPPNRRPARRAPRAPGVLARLREVFAATPFDIALTLTGLALLSYAAPRLLRWALLDAVWIAASPDVCRTGTGACWAVVSNHLPLIVFGLYPAPERWRPLLGLALVLLSLLAAFWLSAHRIRSAAVLVAAAFIAFCLLMAGGLFGLAPVSPDQWGGLPLTLMVFVGTVAVGFPFAILLALCRVSGLPILRRICASLIEVVRAVPLLTILFCAAVVMPLAVPGWFTPGKMVRIILGMALFYACYQAEVIRGGLQGVAHGQTEAAESLGIRRPITMLLIVLPQALRITLPATVNLLVVAFKDTSLVVVVGLFDLVASANASVANDAWSPFFSEMYLFVAGVFLIATGAISYAGGRIERKLALRA